MRILIADDHSVVRRGIRQILADAFGELVTGEASNAAEALEMIGNQDWDAVVLDISMPGQSGLEAIKEIRKSRPKLPILVLSIHPEDHFAARVFKAGASGYMTKETAPEELVDAINRVIAGKKYVSVAFAEKLAANLEKGVNDAPPHKRLSDREYEVLLLIASGNSLSEIAEQLSLSVKTISTYRSRILEKTDLHSNADLVRYAIAHGLIE
jgi:two-component system invasion response regulator UvrY